MFRSSLVAISLALLGPAAVAQVRSGQEAWGPAPPGLPPGAQVAVLFGDPGKAGPFIIRAKMPAGYTVPPHSHPTAENVTLLSGDLRMGMGEKLDPPAAAQLKPGDFISLEARMNHFAISEKGAVIQISSQGPFAINYVNPADDPRRK